MIVLITSIITIFSLVILSIVYLPLLDFDSLQKRLIQWDNEGKEVLATGRKISEYTQGNNHEKYYAEYYDKTEYILTDSNPFFPKITFIAQRKVSSPSETPIIYVDIFELVRNGILSYDLYEQRGITVENKSYEEVKQIVKQYDLLTYNPDPQNIKVRTPPTKAQIDQQKEGKERAQIKENLRTKYLEKLFDADLTRDQKLAIAKDFLNQYKTAEAQLRQNPDATFVVVESTCKPEYQVNSNTRLCNIEVMIDELQTGIAKLEKGDNAFVITNEYLESIDYFRF